MGLFPAFEISASALTAERMRMSTIMNNLANATRTAEGGPYRRKRVVFSPRGQKPEFFFRLPNMAKTQELGKGVRVQGIYQDPSPFRMVHDPGHPDANVDGYVAMPNINPVTEWIDFMTATRAYEANLTVMNAAKGMATKTLDILKG